MTGLNNRRAFFELGGQVVKEIRRSGEALSAIMLDIDHFKKVNDTYGHDIGDQTIIALAECIQSAAREADICARFGGEEFVILLPRSTSHDATRLASRLRDQVKDTQLSAGEEAFFFTVSIGVAEYRDQGETLEELLKKADLALYQAKEGGRDKIVVADT